MTVTLAGQQHELCNAQHPTQPIKCALVKNPWSHDHVGHREGDEPLEQRTVTWAPHERLTEPICPPWCAGHAGRYQGWDDRGDGGQTRNHGEEGSNVADVVWVSINVEEDERHTLSEAIVDLLVDGIGGGMNVDLTPSQARAVAALLVKAADTIDALEEAQR